MNNHIDNLRYSLSEINKSDFNTYRSCVIALFDYLRNQFYDNEIYKDFESRSKMYDGWPEVFGNYRGIGQWTYPAKLEDSILLSYSLHKNIAHYNQSRFIGILYKLYGQNDNNISVSKFKNRFFSSLEKATEQIIEAAHIQMTSTSSNNSDTVFIIHGHDHDLLAKVQLFLERGKVKNKVLHEQPDQGRTIIEKLINETEDASFAIALFTPDDLTDGKQFRARQNVILEVGYFLGKLGRSKVRMIVKEDIEIPSDLTGILYDKYDIGQSWKLKLIRELKAAGIEIDSDSALKT